MPRRHSPHLDSSLSLVFQEGRSLDPVAFRAVLLVAGALVAERITDRGEYANCDIIPFGHDLKEGVELDISPSVDFLTWAQLEAVIRGLQLFQIDGERFYSYYFEICDSDALDVYTRIGWGNIGKPSKFSNTQLLGSAPLRLSRPIARRAVDHPPATSGRDSFRIPGSQLILVPRSSTTRYPVQSELTEAILFTSDTWVARKISIFGENGPADFIFDHGTGDKPHARLIVWSSMVKNLTWGQLKTIIDGLWAVLVDQQEYQYTTFRIYVHEVDDQFCRGWGTIVVTDGPARRPLLGVTPSNSTSNSTPNSTSTDSLSTSKRALQISPAEGLPALNISQSVNTVIFQIPSSEMKLEFQDHTDPPHQLPGQALNVLLLSAAVDLDQQVERFGKTTPSSGQEYAFSIMEGVGIWLLKVYRPPLGYLTYNQMRTMIVGLQFYMVLGRRPQAVRFKVLYGANNVTLGHGVVAEIW